MFIEKGKKVRTFSMAFSDDKNKLENVLNDENSFLDEILKKKTLKEAHIYCKINKLSGQISGNLIEKYIENKFNMKHNKCSDKLGDACKGSKNFEIKISNGGKTHSEFNFVQIRLNHNCDYLFSAYYICKENLEFLGELFIFKLDKKAIQHLILKHGKYAHGTIDILGKITKDDISNNLNNKEYALRPKYGDKCWNDLLKYRISEDKI